MLGAEFVAWVQVLIYVGAIVILFLFGLMLTKAPIGRDLLDNQQRPVAAAIGARDLRRARLPDPEGLPAGSGQHDALVRPRPASSATSIFRGFVLPFEAISFLLLAALIGAIVLSRKDEEP